MSSIEFDPPLPTPPPADVQPAPAITLPRPYSFWPTVGLSAAAFAITIVAQIGLLILFMITHAVMSTGPHDESPDLEKVATPGAYTALAIALGSLLIIGFIWLMIALRKWRVREYLCLVPLRVKSTIVGMLSLAAFVAIEIVVTGYLERPIPQFMLDLVGHSGALMAFIFFSVVVVGPVSEEVLIRGFLFRGVAESRGGPVAAVLLSSFLWTIIHLQYEPFEMATIFLLGILLGVVRLRTGSLSLCILLHMATNLYSMVALLLVTRGESDVLTLWSEHVCRVIGG